MDSKMAFWLGIAAAVLRKVIMNMITRQLPVTLSKYSNKQFESCFNLT